jgi:hypothetical protein
MRALSGIVVRYGREYNGPKVLGWKRRAVYVGCRIAAEMVIRVKITEVRNPGHFRAAESGKWRFYGGAA